MKIIMNADDFGMSETVNEAIIEGYNAGMLTSTCVMTNMPEFESGVEKIKNSDIGYGVHLNIIEGKSLSDVPLLTDKNGIFNNGFLNLLNKSFDKKFLEQVEKEFRVQIETALRYRQADRLDSHVHTHAIPFIFNIVCKLAKEYGIPCVRTQFEMPYAITNKNKMFSKTFLINLIKICILDFFTVINRFTLKKYGLKTNDEVIGVGYTGMMDEETITEGIKSTDCGVLEVICHPDKNEGRKSNYTEYKSLFTEKLKTELKNRELIKYRNLTEHL